MSSVLDFPKNVTLDGELFGGRRKFQDTVSIVKTINSPHWQGITFQVGYHCLLHLRKRTFSKIVHACQIFDVPTLVDEPFEKRLEYLQKTFGPGGTHAAPHVVVVEQIKAKDKEHVLQQLKEVESLGGEGVMLRRPES